MRHRWNAILCDLSLTLCLAAAVLWIVLPSNDVAYSFFLGRDPTYFLFRTPGAVGLSIESDSSLKKNPDSTGDANWDFIGFGYLRDSVHSNCRFWNIRVPLWFLVVVFAVLPIAWAVQAFRRRIKGTPRRGFALN